MSFDIRLSRGIWGAAICLVLVAAAIYAGTSSAQLPIVDAQALDLGEMSAAGEHVIYLPIRNPSLQTISIDAIHVSCGCTRIHPSRLQLAPLQTSQLKLTLNLADRVAVAANKDQPIPFEVTLTPEIAAADLGAVEWTLRGTILVDRAADSAQPEPSAAAPSTPEVPAPAADARASAD